MGYMRRHDDLTPTRIIHAIGLLRSRQFPHPERSLRAVRSIYNDGRARNGSALPSEFFLSGGGGSGSGSGRGMAPNFMASAAVAAGGSGFGSSALMSDYRSRKRPISPLSLGGGKGGVLSLLDTSGGSGGSNSNSLAPLMASGGGSQTPQRRGSFQSNASLDFGMTFTSGDEVNTRTRFVCIGCVCGGVLRRGEVGARGGNQELARNIRELLFCSRCRICAHAHSYVR